MYKRQDDPQAWKKLVVKNAKRLALHVENCLWFVDPTALELSVDHELTDAMQKIYDEIIIPYVSGEATNTIFTARAEALRLIAENAVLEGDIELIEKDLKKKNAALKRKLKRLTGGKK